MKLVGFSTKNYRSISDAYKLPLANYTVIVGPNNEGKSNVLKGLAFALDALTGVKKPFFGRRRYLQMGSPDYVWERDFPMNLQESKPDGKSEFICEFELNASELVEFKKKTGVNLNTVLKVQISVGKGDNVKVDFLMKGKGKRSLNTKRVEISEFVSEKIFLQYIPAIRTSELAIRIVEDLLARELSILSRDPSFREALALIARLQKPVVDRISANLNKSISSFVPDVKSISIKNRESLGRLMSTSCEVYIDDGIETELQLKGDGVVSLTAISLLQHVSKEALNNKSLVLVVEEPESHLHPQAIHNLKKILYEISSTSQVIVTTHSPIMVERLEAGNNIIVQNRKANPAANLSQIRDSLGVQMSDNLSNAFLILLVEGSEDALILQSWLSDLSQPLRDAFSSGSLVVDNLGGATNLAYKASLHKNNLCNIFAYLDNDEAGVRAIGKALEKGFIRDNEYLVSSCRGMKESELEDLVDIDSYRDFFMETYGVDLKVPSFTLKTQKWSKRVEKIFIENGKIWRRDSLSEIKKKLSSYVVTRGIMAMRESERRSVDTLVASLERILKK